MPDYTRKIVDANIVFHDFSEEQFNRVYNILLSVSQTQSGRVLFDNSKVRQESIHFYIRSDISSFSFDGTVVFWPFGGQTNFKPGEPEVYINPNDTSLTYINNLGNVERFSLERIVIHEFIHASLGYHDLAEPPAEGENRHVIEHVKRLRIPDADFQGETVKKTNEILQEMGISTQRMHYITSDVYGPEGTQWTEKNLIENVYLGLNKNDLLKGGSKNELFLGGSGNDEIIASGGNDYIYGGKDKDTLSGGKGNDFLDGGDDNDTALYEGNLANYDVQFLENGSIRILDNKDDRDDSDTLKNIEFAQFSDKLVDLRPGQDIAFVIDTTSSMEDDIGAVKSRASEIINAVFDSDRGLLDSQIAVVGYNDPITNTFLKFTEQPSIKERRAAAINAINSISVSGGDDPPEAVNAGLIRALDGRAGQWRGEAKVRRIILFGDAPPKDNELRSQVLSLANNISVSIPSGPSLLAASLAISSSIETENLSDKISLTSFDLNEVTASGEERAVPVEIFTIQIGNDPETATDFAGLAKATNGESFSSVNADTIADVLIDAITTNINQPPIAVDDSFETAFGTPLVITSANLSANDIDANRDALSITKVRSLSGGSVEIDANNRIVFTPDASFLGDGSFEYTVSDGNASDVGIVTISVLPPEGAILGSGSNDRLSGTDNDDILLGLGGDDTLSGNAGNDILFGGVGQDTIFGQLGNDTIEGGTGRDKLNGGGGQDMLRGQAGNDQLTGGSGNDSLVGGAGSDIYIYRAGDGEDRIQDNGNGDGDTLFFNASIDFNTVTFSRRENLPDDLVVRIGSSGDSILIKEQFAADRVDRIEVFNFNNVTTLSYTDIAALV